MNKISKVSGIILSAGFSSRMKTNKALLEMDGKTFLENIFSKLNDCVREVIVVLGHGKEEILSEVKLPGAKIVFNENFKAGQFSSLKKGISAMSPDSEGFMLNPVDCPLVRKETYREMLELWGQNGSRILIPVFNGMKGHPAIFPASAAGEILKSPDDTAGGVRFFLKKYGNAVSYFKTSDKGVIIDADTPEDLLSCNL
ncbi:MAG: nucleotidyltransferase family protein [bacterium]